MAGGEREKVGGLNSALAEHVNEISEQTLAAWREAPNLIIEHHNLELAAVEGGYGRRQLYELVQNGADSCLAPPAGSRP